MRAKNNMKKKNYINLNKNNKERVLERRKKRV
jgi:hypothetical protein